MLIKRLLVVVMIGLILSAPAALLAQDLTQTYTSGDGRITLNYPAGWISKAGSIFGTGLYTSEAAVSSSFGAQGPGDAAMFFLLSDSPGSESLLGGGSTPDAIVNTLATFFASGSTASAPVSTEIAGKPAIYVEVTGDSTNAFLSAIDLGDGLSLVAFAFTAPGELATFEPQFLAILNTLQFSSTAVTPVPVELNLQVITTENAAQLKQIWTVNPDRSCYNAGSVSPDGQRIAICDLRKNLALMESGTGNVLESLSPGVTTEETVAYRTLFSPDGQTLAVAEGPRMVLLHDMNSKTDTTVQLDQPTLVMDMAFKPDGSALAYITREAGVVGLVKPDGTSIQTIPLDGAEGASVAYSPTGDTVVFSSWFGFGDTTVSLWDVAQNKLISATPVQGAPLGVDFLPDGKAIAVNIDYKTNNLSVWDVAANSKIAELSGHTEAVVRVAFSPDGMLLATASNDTTVRVWNVQSGEQLASLPHEYTDLRVSFSQDGRMLLTADQVGNTFLWGVQ